MGPLAGVKIIEMAGVGPAPFAGMLLADMGADVCASTASRRRMAMRSTLSQAAPLLIAAAARSPSTSRSRRQSPRRSNSSPAPTR